MGVTRFEAGRKIVEEHRKLIQVSKLNFQPDDIAFIKKAYKFIYDTDYVSLHVTGIPLITHATAIARIVAEQMSLGPGAIVSALLHPYVEADKIHSDTIKEVFGMKILEMIQSLIKISGIQTKDSSEQAENFRKLLLTMASDVRVILIKIAERLQIMRTMEHLDQQTHLKIASETSYLYAPLAHRLGLYSIKSELEDISMHYTHPEKYSFITKKLKETEAKRNKFIKDFIAPLNAKLKADGLTYEIKGRTKSVFSIFNKMQKQNVEFEEVYDIFAIRIIAETPIEQEKSVCWHIYSLVADTYQPNPKRLRDWISVPKSNGYESLHTTVIGPEGKWVEVQIRTRRMNEVAEKGLAAHWKYKGLKGEKGVDEWLTKMREVLESADTRSGDFIDDVKLSLYNKEIFVFTPKGDLKRFPLGATVLDFAFDIHTDVGIQCVGAKINGRNVPIRYTMQNGDKVEILTSKNQKPKQDWLDFVVTSKAKSKIKLMLKEEVFRESENGREMLKRRLKNWKLPFNDVNINILLKHYKVKTSVDLYYLISTEKVEMSEIKELLTKADKPEPDKLPEKIDTSIVDKIVNKAIQKSDDFLVIEDIINNIDYKLSPCCNPIFGDEIFGFVTIHDGIKIHRINCPNASQMITKYGYRVVKARWTQAEKTPTYQAGIRITGIDDVGIIGKISELISRDLKINMRSVNFESNDGLFEGTLQVFVKDTLHLKLLIDNLSKMKGILKAKRIESE